jgi:Predicted Zn-dependent proteases
MRNQVVRIIPVGEIERVVLDSAATALAQQYALETAIEASVPYSALNLDPSATPHSAEQILAALVQQDPEQIELLITRLPITHDGRKLIFGLADPASSACVLSTYWLFQATDDSTYTDNETAIARVRKEAVHEVGHALGYSHCGNDDCVMSFSIDVSSIDQKSEQLCPACTNEILEER